MKIHRVLVVVALLSALTIAGQTIGGLQARDKMLDGVRQFDAGHYDAAIPFFQEALRLDPQLINAEVYLATSYARLYVPGVTSEQNLALATKAIAGFESILNRQPNNSLAISGLAMTLQSSGNNRRAHEYFLRNADLNPTLAVAPYQVAAHDWIMASDKSNPPSPQEAESFVDEGLRHVDRALAINPDYSDAMAYKNLLIREKARLTWDPAERLKLNAEADRWFQMALDSRKRNQARSQSNMFGAIPPPPPPPPPRPQTIRTPGGGMGSNLLYQTDPEYPAPARAARIQGIVIIEALIGKDGAVESAKVLSGHPLLTQAAVDCVKKWRYRPVMLNGEATDVLTTVTVSFRLQ